ncbi:MAG: sigma 54-interacting transcriptional regulator [Candidatus Hydrogenedentes bacterium]|nr:sigma 54-interacting transcriptional regulator [Candidatus Hydrogenedentota bacterium]
MRHIFFAWIGHTDLKAALGHAEAGVGPLAQGLAGGRHDEAHLLSDHPPAMGKNYIKWLEKRTGTSLQLHPVRLKSPTDLRQIYEAVTKVLDAAARNRGETPEQWVYHLSPGTPAMASVWLLLGKTVYPARLIESSPQAGVKTVDVPFDIAADYIPKMLEGTDARAVELAQAAAPPTPEFGAILHKCDAMKKVVARARHVALHDVPVLILGESGTGKELLARAIHSGSPRRDGPFVAVNCGAIPADLVESEFFGHRKGAFTGADKDRRGYLEEASGGTLLLDEVGELPRPAQVKLLRALQTGEIQKIGDTRTVKVDFRVLAATNRDLLREVMQGRFREDLFHRLAVGVLHLPPLRERHGDLPLLCERILEGINARCASVPGWKHKNISNTAKILVHNHAWPGNVRELGNTLARAAIWCQGDTIGAENLKEALLTVPGNAGAGNAILGRALGEGFSLPEVMTEVARHYLGRALKEAHGNKTRAAELAGLPSYQTLTNWLQRYGIENDLAR